MNINFSVYYILQYEVCSVLMGFGLVSVSMSSTKEGGPATIIVIVLMYSTPSGLACGLGPPPSGLRLAVEGPPEGRIFSLNNV
jgi:hypothetical protein